MFLSLFGVILSVLIFFKFINPCTYWKEKGIKHARAWPLVGSIGKVIFKKQSFVDFIIDLYNEFPNERFVGFVKFNQNYLLLRDTELIRNITERDFNYFQDQPKSVQFEKDSLLSKSLIGLSGEQWRDMRATLSPAFTSNAIRNMYPFIEKCAQNFVNFYKAEVEVEVKEVFSRFVNDVIASTAFGAEIDSLKEPHNDFYVNALLLTTPTFLQKLPKNAVSYFEELIRNSIKQRESETDVRPDLIHLLLEARKGRLKFESYTRTKGEGFAINEEPEIDPLAKQVALSDDHILAQALFFFFTAFETVSTASTFLAYELAVNIDIQKKLQREIDQVMQICNGEVPYDVLLSMKYLDRIVSECLRKWPPVFESERLCTREYTIKSESLQTKTFLLKKGVPVLIPIMAIHRDPSYYPNPNRFDPERFNDENKSQIIPGSYIPFGLGPRNCIGSRIAVLEIKTLFCYLLSKYDIGQVKKTQMPIRISRGSFRMEPEEGVWLCFKPRI